MFIIILDKLSKTSASKILPFNVLRLNMQTFAIHALLRFQPNSGKKRTRVVSILVSTPVLCPPCGSFIVQRLRFITFLELPR